MPFSGKALSLQRRGAEKGPLRSAGLAVFRAVCSGGRQRGTKNAGKAAGSGS